MHTHAQREHNGNILKSSQTSERKFCAKETYDNHMDEEHQNNARYAWPGFLTTFSYPFVEPILTDNTLQHVVITLNIAVKKGGKEAAWLNTSHRTEDNSIDRLPNYGPGTSKRYRKLETTGNTVISDCEKRNFRRSSDLAEGKIYLFAIPVVFDMPSTDHFFWSFWSQVGMTMVLVGFSGAFISGHSELLYRDFDKVSGGLDISKAGWSF